ncbi:hypothetical protein E2C01_051368 [Portunus trituberculatus]|uniref:Uncharacterized protein n=1 Tax=Portunus trituberculatus TaxID=210409 RepID=A0A5B7GIQ4_PORTR|nr:hypothetical protein [Portunus trituberculatus]
MRETHSTFNKAERDGCSRLGVGVRGAGVAPVGRGSPGFTVASR